TITKLLSWVLRQSTSKNQPRKIKNRPQIYFTKKHGVLVTLKFKKNETSQFPTRYIPEVKPETFTGLEI
ncbi:hypothetical protein ACTXN4_28955, partial [Pseudomonas helleri]|uniref:hypothetical protein n=1 Tax=Pseudomonas helleri TaxID=1608996 RepID=UPI003FD4BCC3